MPEPQTHVIVGGGLAGAKAAEALRTEGFEGRIVLLARGARAALRAPAAVEGLPARRVRAREGPRASRGVLRRPRRSSCAPAPRSTGIDTAAREVALGRRRADALRPAAAGDRRAPAPARRPRRRPRRRPDAARPRRRRRAARAAVAGRACGRRRRRLDRRRGRRLRPAARAARSRSSNARRCRSSASSAASSAASTRDIHRDHGVELLTGAGLSGFEGDGARRARRARRRPRDRLRPRRGRRRRGAAHRAGRGGGARRRQRHPRRPSTSQTSVPGIFAAGDVANVAHPFYGRRLRVEHWANALHQPEVAARAMLGKPAV